MRKLVGRGSGDPSTDPLDDWRTRGLGRRVPERIADDDRVAHNAGAAKGSERHRVRRAAVAAGVCDDPPVYTARRLSANSIWYSAYAACSSVRATRSIVSMFAVVTFDGDVAWLLPAGERTNWRGHITGIGCEFAR